MGIERGGFRFEESGDEIWAEKRKSNFLRLEMVTGLVKTHSWIIHLWRGDSATLSMAEKTAQ